MAPAIARIAVLVVLVSFASTGATITTPPHADRSDPAPENTVASAAVAARARPSSATSLASPEASTTKAATNVPHIVQPSPATAPSTVPVATETVHRSAVEAGPVNEVTDPIAIRIPSIGVDSPLVPTGVLDDGTVDVPADANIAGWFNGGPRPGERGPSVIMGHVDSASTGPGVFYELRNIEVGSIVTVDNAEGSIDFVVERVEQHAKLDFPTERVYGPSPSAALRLVTCGGSFDRSARSYFDNIIVYLNPVTV